MKIRNSLFILTFIAVQLAIVSCESRQPFEDFNTNTSSFESENEESATDEETTTDETTSTNTGYTYTVSDLMSDNQDSHEESGDYTWSESDITEIILSDNSISIDGDGATVSNAIVTISNEGTYRITGTSSDIQVLVDTEDEGNVQIILNGANMTCSTSAPIFAKSAEKVIIILADNTTNYITDASTYQYDSSDEDEPNAAIHSKADLSFSGSGTLNLTANYNDGITSKDGLIIKEGTYNITASDDGIRGKDYLTIDGGTFNIDAGGDGLKSDNDDDTDRGYILINDGYLTINAGADGMQAETDLLIADGTVDITSGGGSNSSVGADDSAKGLKANLFIISDGGTFTLNTADDAIHSDSIIVFNNGNYTLSTGDDAMHSEYDLSVNGGDINIEKSYEGIEAMIITINDGDIIVNSSDDGLNASGGTTTSTYSLKAGPGGNMGGNNGPDMGGDTGGDMGGQDEATDAYIYINGGYLAIYASGDGVDSNGNLDIEGGTILVHGPAEGGNGSIDYNGTGIINGGTLICAGSSDMTQGFDTSSNQYSVILTFDNTISSGTLVNIQNTSGDEIFTFKSAVNFQALIFSTPDLTTESYVAYTGGSYSGSETDGYYTGGNYTAGTQYTTFTITSISTSIGSH